MRIFFLILITVGSIQPITPQKNDVITLYSIDSVMLRSINNQGLKLFKKSDCYNQKEKYFSIPEFFVLSKIPLKEMKFDSVSNLLNNLFFERKATRKLLNEIHWNIFLNKNTCVKASSDFKQFYCYEKDNRFIDIEKFKNFRNKTYILHNGNRWIHQFLSQ